jgi:hypothetical protein
MNTFMTPLSPALAALCVPLMLVGPVAAQQTLPFHGSL